MSEWIRVEDRLPKPFQVVLVYMPHVCRCAGYLNSNKDWIVDRVDLSGIRVTHWTPIPDPPKVGK